MAKAPGGRRPEATADDKFVTTTLSILAWAQKNTRALVLGGLAVALLVFGVLYYTDYRRRVRDVASSEIRAIRFELAQGTDIEGTVEQLLSFLARLEGSPYNTEARLLLANALLRANRAAEAVGPALEASTALGKDPLATRAAFLLAAAYEEVADTAAAIDTYEEIGDKARARLDKQRGYEGAARLRAATGELAEAALLYDRLVELIPEENPRRGLYEMRAAELRASGVSPTVSATDDGGGSGK